MAIRLLSGGMDDRRTIRLLVVEDDPAYLYLIKRAFAHRVEKTRWDLTTAENGEEALRLLFEEEQDQWPLPDLILLDWNLPKVGGGEVLRRLKEHKNLRRIPVLVFSTSDSDEDVRGAYGMYANGYINKPKDPEILSAIAKTIEEFWISVSRLSKVTR